MATNRSHATGRRPKVGVSSCLLGERVRYDGGHKLNRIVVGELSEIFDWVPVCPEVESGLGNPRPPMRLIRIGEAVRLRVIGADQDVTDQMERSNAIRIHELLHLGLAGFVLKSRSPSCGLGSVEIMSADSGRLDGRGTGVFARLLTDQAPELPLIEERDLLHAERRQRFVDRVLRRWREFHP